MRRPDLDKTSLPRPAGTALLPLGALAAGFGFALGGAQAQMPAATANEATLAPIKVRAQAEAAGRDAYRATETRIGKGQQELRDIPQSVTVVTEKLIDDRNLDTMKDVLKNTSGISFLAAEGGEEDIRLRGFSLQATGDVFVDGMRDPAFYERDTFFLDRLEVLRGSASMLFGRGSTGGAVNQVTKVPRLIDENQVDVTMGNHAYVRAVGDFNLKLGESSALRLGTMVTKADNNGAGTSLDKRGAAVTYRWGIGERDEFSVGAYVLDNDNGMNYGMPWIRPTLGSAVSDSTLLPISPSAYYGMASDRNAGGAQTLTATHTHRFGAGTELVSRLRRGAYERDQRAGTVRFAAAALQPSGLGVSLASFGPGTVINRGTQLKIQDMDTIHAQSDLSTRFQAGGMGHEVQAGADFAREEKEVLAARSAAQGGVTLTKPSTTVGTPDDGAAIAEDARVLRRASTYTSKAAGVYVQDLVEFMPDWKLLAGLRYDYLVGAYDSFAIPANAPGPQTTASYSMKVSEVSKRLGLLYQPSPRMSFHLSGATSFNTSGEAYSLSAANADIPPEQSVNVELGARIDSADGHFTSRAAIFRTTKLHERNTDPLVNLVTLSGKRHAAGIELDLTGRITPAWEVYGSYMWIPVAKIDQGVAGSEGQGTRPSLTPRHSGTIWSTYKLSPALRVGGGLNARSSQTPIRNPGFAAPRFVTADLMAEFTALPERLVYKINVSNLTDKLYADQLYTGHYIPGPGRLIQATASFRF
ncbi:TonB-dependent siderophore receptor [Rhizobacter sp. AJA081-3]|uniref:TonB-dependent receptor n=1 Tax=Rhizobacter sp. AJA081-3 TaxID=2753607 RepID=UPI001ADFAFFA|nr:TonB-dependent siderophore receptor [Rhizobacter sp. AJA081-3]QTN22891.1 TonB-dependent siderophore receptor [Rhizobacter sp. AJA081-3]